MDTQNQFIELRAKNWSLARIAEHLKVSIRTLVEWNRQFKAEIRNMRAIELEALQEKLIASHEQELTHLTQILGRLEKIIEKRNLSGARTKDLLQHSAVLRAEIRKLRVDPDMIEPAEPAVPQQTEVKS